MSGGFLDRLSGGKDLSLDELREAQREIEAALKDAEEEARLADTRHLELVSALKDRSFFEIRRALMEFPGGTEWGVHTVEASSYPVDRFRRAAYLTVCIRHKPIQVHLADFPGVAP